MQRLYPPIKLLSVALLSICVLYFGPMVYNRIKLYCVIYQDNKEALTTTESVSKSIKEHFKFATKTLPKLYSFYKDRDYFLQLDYQKPLPAWARQNIASIASTYNEADHGLAIKYFDHLNRSSPNHHMALVTIKDGKIKVQASDYGTFDVYVMKLWLELMQSKKLLTAKDLAFILNIYDNIPDGIEFEGKTVPLLAFAIDKNSKFFNKGTILVPDLLQLKNGNDLYKAITSSDTSWNLKTNKAFWRGDYNNYCVRANPDGRFDLHCFPRGVTAKLSLDNDQIDAKFTISKPTFFYYKYLSKGTRISYKKTVDAISVPDPDRMFDKYTSFKRYLSHKYLINIDGITASFPGFYWKLASNSVVIKQESPYVQWYFNALKPYVHYVPVKNDMSNLSEVVTWLQNNDDKAHQIAQNASEFAKNNLSTEDCVIYWAAALNAYADVAKPLRS